MIRFDSVIRTYGKKVAVNGLNLDIPGGEIFAFLGPNGAGKTTSIKMMVGLLAPNEGAVTVGGFDTQTQAREAKSKLGYVPDQPELYEKLSGREFLQFVAEMHGMPEGATAEKIEDLARTFEFEDYYDQLTEGYSHGMKQRVAFAAALLHEPDVIILDEPMVGLDPRTMRIVKDTLRRRAADGATIFMSTHTLGVAEEIADRIGVILNGQLLFLGSVAELRERLSLGDSSLEDLYLTLTESLPGSDEVAEDYTNVNGSSNGSGKNRVSTKGAKDAKEDVES